MIRQLLIRGLIAGLVAGLLAFAFARWVGEPTVARAIVLESAPSEAAHSHSHATGESVEAKAHTHSHGEASAEGGGDELVSRDTQAGLGLFVGIVVFTTALGGLFSLVFAVAYGRWSPLQARALALAIALAGFACIALIPFIKYPPNPPAVGQGGTIELRTALFFGAIGICIAALVVSIYAGRKIAAQLSPWGKGTLQLCIFAALSSLGMMLLPSINEVPDNFPASLLWDFRVAALGMQMLIWGCLGLVFGWLAEIALEKRPPQRLESGVLAR